MINEVLQWCAIAAVLLLAAINNRIGRSIVETLGHGVRIDWPVMVWAAIFPWTKPQPKVEPGGGGRIFEGVEMMPADLSNETEVYGD